jgi:hypothetical protein
VEAARLFIRDQRVLVKVALAFLVCLLAGFLPFGAWAKENNFEGTITATEENGQAPTAFLYTRKGDLVRIETPDAKTPVPINVLNLAQQKLTIIYPHNRSFVNVDLITKPASVAGVSDRGAGKPPTLPGFPTPPKLNASPSEAATGGRPGPSISLPPGFPQPPPIPSMPPMPNPAMTGPMMPQMGMGTKLELKKTDKTRKIQGFDCALYTLSDRAQTMEIWATSDEALFPFHTLETNHLRRRFGPQILEEQWIEVLQNKSLFPMEAASRLEGTNQERLFFKVDKIENKKIDNGALFKPPENYQQFQAPQF